MPLLVCEALFGLFAYDLVLSTGKFKMIHRLVAGWKTKRRVPGHEFMDQIAHAINLACIWYPKQVPCLQRSSVTTCLMRSYGIAAQMVLGAQKTPFLAHAWVEVDGKAVNERSSPQERYKVWERY